jgi:hypothetical protein
MVPKKHILLRVIAVLNKPPTCLKIHFIDRKYTSLGSKYFKSHIKTTKDRWEHFNFMNFPISTSWIHDFNFMNSRFHVFNCVNTRFQIHEFTIQLQVECVNSWSWNREFTWLKSWSWNREFLKLNSENWNSE